MVNLETGYIGFTCAYTPLPLIDAAGYVPYRILPEGEAPERAPQILNDNLCPHVKRVLDRALNDEIPDPAGMIFVASCDAMRRLADAWQKVRPTDRTILIDLPVTAGHSAVTFLSQELSRLTDELADWSGKPVTESAIRRSATLYDSLAERFDVLRSNHYRGRFTGGVAKLQDLYNRASTLPVHDAIRLLDSVGTSSQNAESHVNGVPVYLFGNVIPEPSALGIFESCGVKIVGDDLCTGSRLFQLYAVDSRDDPFRALASNMLGRRRCARTLDPGRPGLIAEEIVEAARACNAKGVIAHSVKFCDAYFARLPLVRRALKGAGLPLLIIEGDCSTGSLGQHKTRIEAFVEMLR